MPPVNVYTGGTFDMFHAGHVAFLRAARALGDSLTVSLNSDAFVAQFKRKTVCTYAEREAVVAACRYVDEVVLNVGGADSRPAIVWVDPDIIAVGDDWRDRNYLGQLGIDQDFLDAHRIEIKYLPYTTGISSTDIIERIRGRS